MSSKPKRGRPRKKKSDLRVHMTARVRPDVARFLLLLSIKLKKSVGAIIDDLVDDFVGEDK